MNQGSIFARPHEDVTRATWPMVRLGDVLTHRKEFIQIDDTREYLRCRVQLHAKGIVLRDRVEGALIKTKEQQLCRAGEFLVAQIDAKVGGFGIVPPELEASIVSSHYFLFTVNANRLDRYFLNYYSKTAAFRDQVRAQGSTNYAAIRPGDVLDYTIPLPTLSEQRRIVAKLDQLSAKVTETRRILNRLEVESDQLRRAIISDTRFGPIRLTPMSELVTFRQPDTEVAAEARYQFAGVYCFGRGVFRGPVKAGKDFAYGRLTRLETGDFTYPKLMAWEGAFGIVPPECEGCYVSPEFPVFAVNHERVLPAVLDTHFRNPAVWPSLSQASTGTNVRRRRLHPDGFLAYRLPLPSAEAQRAHQKVHSRLQLTEPLQKRITAELDALMPAILDRTFKGEL